MHSQELLPAGPEVLFLHRVWVGTEPPVPHLRGVRCEPAQCQAQLLHAEEALRMPLFPALLVLGCVDASVWCCPPSPLASMWLQHQGQGSCQWTPLP